MNKTISINLGGSIFNIEEDAFFVLRTYLESIKANFTGDPASEEIMQDIEVRIAELFNERMNDRKNVVVRSDVDEVIGIMGQPEDYKVDEDDKPKGKHHHSGTRHSQRRLYRDEDDKVVAGVCSGLSYYFGIDPIIVRLIVVLLFFFSGGTAILGYILFWALVPKAETTAERLQMRGEPVDVNNISRMVNDEAKAAADKVGKYGQRAAQQARATASGAASGLGKVLTILFGFIIMMMGFGLLIGLLSMLMASNFDFFGFGAGGFEMLNQLVYNYDGTLWLIATGVVLTMAAPAVALIYTGIRLLTGSSKKIKGLSMALVSLFIIGIILCMWGGMKTVSQMNHENDIVTSSLIDATVGDTLHVQLIPDTILSLSSRRSGRDFSELTRVTEQYIYYGEPIGMHFEPTIDKDYKVQVRRMSHGSSSDEARALCKNMTYDYSIQGDTALFAGYFATPAKDLYRMQHVEIVIYVPVGKFVSFGEGIHHITWAGEVGDVLRMDKDGLESEKEWKENHTSWEVTTDNSYSTEETNTVRLQDGELSVKSEVKRKRND